MTFSIIIPHRNSVELLPKLLSTIPDSPECEIIVVDNSPEKVAKDSILTDRKFSLLYSEPSRGAGGARNVGIENAQGKWLIFADADDFFTDDAFSVFESFKDSDADLVYTCMDGIYLDTGGRSDRGDEYNLLIKNYLNGIIPETDLRFKFSSPCAKMVNHGFVNKYALKYDEVVASNDMYFSMLCGYYAKKIDATDKVTYICTVNRGSLTRRRDFPVIYSRFKVNLRYNYFLKTHGFASYQRSILFLGFSLCKFGFTSAFNAVKLLIQYRQNPFIGHKNWISTIKRKRISDKKEKRYIVK